MLWQMEVNYPAQVVFSDLIYVPVSFLYFVTLSFAAQKREVNTVLADVIKHMTPDRAFEDAYPQVKNLFCQICKNLMCTFLNGINS